ncbi:MAG: YkgJ family cysteine cluster protein [Candidatus Sericytochromatia bacterium]
MPEKTNFEILNNYLLDLQRVDNLEKMQDLVKTLTDALDEVYPCISCKTGCYTCCTGASMPNVYAKEWQRIREYIKNLDEDTQNNIKNKALDMINRKGELFQFIHNVLHQKITENDLTEFAQKISTELKCESCPLHQHGKCSVYEVRPIKCRVFGYFSFVFENKVQFLSCESDTTKMSDYLNKNKTKQVILPYWNSFEIKLVNFVLDDNEKYQMTVIPMWLKEDYESGRL